MRKRGGLSQFAVPGAELSVHVTPNARQNAVEAEDGVLRVRTTATPEGGKATEAVQKQLAQALGIAKSRLTLVRGATSRHKVFRISE